MSGDCTNLFNRMIELFKNLLYIEVPIIRPTAGLGCPIKRGVAQYALGIYHVFQRL